MASRILTITVGNEVIKICDISRGTQKSVQINKAITIDTPEYAVEDGMIKDVTAIAGALKHAIEENQITLKTVVFCVQSTKIANKEITVPDIKTSKLSAYINTNATDYFPVNIEDYILAYSVLEKKMEQNNKVNRIMAAAAPVNMIESYYELAEMLNFRVEAIEYAGNAILQFIRYQVDTAPGIVIQMAEDSTIVTILKDNVLQLMRTVPYGKSTVATAIMEKNGVTYNEAVAEMANNKEVLKASLFDGDEITDSLKYLVNNISRVMDYYTQKNPDFPIEKAYVLVEGSSICGIEKLLTNELNINVSILEPDKTNVTVTKDEEIDITLYIPNVGAVIKPFNFIPKSAEEKVKKANAGKYYRMTVMLSVLIALLIVVFPLTQYIEKNSEKNSLEEQIRNLNSIRATVDAYYDAKDKYSDVQAFGSISSTNNDYTGDFIKYLEANIPSDISVTSMNISEGAVTMTFSGQAKETMAQFIVALKECPNVESTSVFAPSFSENVGPTGMITLTGSLTCQLKAAPEIPGEEETK